MHFLNLIKVDPGKEEHQQFLYEIIEFRWLNHNIVNINHRTDSSIPTFKEHLEVLWSEAYKHHYIVQIGEINIGSCYIDPDHYYGMYLLPKYIKKSLKTYGKKNTELHIKNMPLSVIVFKKMIALHPEITLYYATVNPKNTLSRSVMIEGGHEEVEVVLISKTKNGKALGGEWQEGGEWPEESEQFDTN